MAAKLKRISTKLKPWHKQKQPKKVTSKSRIRHVVRFAVIGCLMLIILAAIGVYAGLKDNVPVKLSGNSTPSNTPAATAAPVTSQSSPAATTPATTTPKSNPSTSLTQGLIQANTQEECTNLYSSAKYSYETTVNELASNLGNNENAAYTTATQQGWSFASLLNTVNSDISNTNGTISQNWNISFNSAPPSGCGNAPAAPALLQVPTCNASDAGGISSCIAQIDPSLGI